MVVLSIWPGRRISEWAIRLWNWRYSPKLDPHIPLRAAIAAAVLGAFSHVFIDSFMHDDMRPLAPFGDGRLTGIIAVEHLQWLCVAAAVLALTLFGVRALFRTAP